MKKVLKITTGEWINASRDKRELTVLIEMGAEVLVMAKGAISDNFKKDMVDGFTVYRFSTRPLGEGKFLNPLNRILSIFVWAAKARKFDADIISGHDLFPLFIGWLSNIGKKNKAKLVYDSHEFEMGRNTNRNIFARFFIKQLERFLISKSAFSIMVNDSIADEVQNIYHLSERPVVVRNIPNYWQLEQSEIIASRKNILKKLNVDDDCFICMYHGAVTAQRGIEEIVEALSKTENTVCVIVGNGTKAYVTFLENLTKKYNVQNRFLFLSAVPIGDLWRIIAASDVGISTPKIKSRSYYFGLGNKIFENIQALTPIICNDTPEMARIVNQYKIGLAINPPGDEGVLAESIRRLATDKELYNSFKKNLQIAKEELCWENEKQVLYNAYKKII